MEAAAVEAAATAQAAVAAAAAAAAAAVVAAAVVADADAGKQPSAARVNSHGKTPRPLVVLTCAVSLCTRWPVTGPIYTASLIPAAGIECCDCGLDRGDPVEIEAPRLVHTDTFVEIPEDALFAWLRDQ